MDVSIPGEVAKAASACVGSELRTVRQLAGGWNNGAVLVLIDGQNAVLKTHGTRTIEELAAIQVATRAATAAGWPTTKLLSFGEVDGVVWSLQEFIHGAPLSTLTSAAAAGVVAANRYQMGLANEITSTRLIDRSQVVRDLLRDRYGYIERLRSVSLEANHLLDLLLERSDPGRDFRHDDLVHGDYNQENILLDGSSVAGFVDTDELGVGDRHFDLVDLFHRSLLRDGPEGAAGRQVLIEEIRVNLDETVFWSYFATTAIGSMDWVADRMPQLLPSRIDALTTFVRVES